MPSPVKRRKLNSGAKEQPSAPPSRGLEYFFSRQRQGALPSRPSAAAAGATAENIPAASAQELADEELARKLQAEWNQEPEPPGENLPDQTLRAGTDETEASSSKAVTPEPATTTVTSTAAPTSARKTATANTLSLQSVAATEDHISASIPLDESPLTFDPAQYIPALQEHWAAEGGDASYGLLARCFVLVNATQSRIKIVDTLVNCLRILIEGDPTSLLPAVWLATNAISPPYISRELGLGGSAISRALKQSCGLDSRALKTLYTQFGDPGDVAAEAKKKQSLTLRRPKPLTIRGVYRSLVKIADSQGQGSVEAKQRIVDRLLQDARGAEESRYIVRTLCQHLRIGAVKTTMLIALSRAFLLSRPPGADFPTRGRAELAALRKEELAEVHARAEETVKACFARRPSYDDLVPALLEVGVATPSAAAELLARLGLAPHVPLRPMLGSITRDLGEMLARLRGRQFACEFKYDGQRAQVHRDAAGRVSIFSRHLELMTDKYPDLVALVPQMIRGGGVASFVLEGEVVAVDRATGALRTFQALSNRARKDVAAAAVTVDVCLFAFDLMFLNGQPLLDRPLRERRGLLRSLFAEVPHRFEWVRSMDATSEDGEAVSEFFRAATEAKCEGIMVKILDNLPELPYQGGAGGAGGGGGGEEEAVEAPSEKLSASKAKSKPKAKSSKTKAKKTPTNPDDTTATSSSSGRRKPLLATYEPDKRLDAWLKVKKDYGAASDTLDLVPVAAWHGQGRKARWWSPILLAVRNEETGALEAVTKCMSGFTDAFYKANRAFYDDGEGEGNGDERSEEEETGNKGERSEERSPSERSEVKENKRKNTRARRPGFVEYAGPEPDVWFEPQEVWETAFADITLSPTYTAAIGLVSEARGLSLRFPRFLRKREDKGIDEASTSAFLAALYRKQGARATLDGPAVAKEGEGEGGEMEAEDTNYVDEEN